MKFTFLTLIFFLLIFQTCGDGSSKGNNKILTVLIEGEITQLDQRYNMKAYDRKASTLIFTGLLTTDTQSLGPELDLAESYRQIDNETYEFKLRKDVVFHDGDPFNADDVIYTFQSILDPKLNVDIKEQYAKFLKSVEKIDDYTVRFTLTMPYAPFLVDLSMGILPSHLYKKGEFARLTEDKLIGTGPFKFVPNQPKGDATSPFGSSEGKEKVLLLQKNNQYYKKNIKIDGVKIQTVKDISSIQLVMMKGNADLTQNTQPDFQSLSQYDPIKHLRIDSSASALLTYLSFNNENTYLKNRNVRQAIAYAINKASIVRDKFLGRAKVAYNFLSEFYSYSNPNVARYDNDLSKANQLLDEAGFEEKQDGYRFELSYLTSSVPFRQELARIIKDNLKQIGINVNIQTIEVGALIDRANKGNFEMYALQWVYINDPDVLYLNFYSHSVPTETVGGYNRYRYKNPEVDRLLVLGRTTADVTKRKEYYLKVQEILANDLPMLPLFNEDNVAVINKRVKGYTILPNASFRGFENIFF